jgi:CelD/BcsL family acetyltransferase involved in cellulose biosynthesis
MDLSTVLAESEWNALVAKDDGASFFQTPTWSSLVALLPGWSAAALAARVNGRLVAALPFLRHTRRGLMTLESMPFGTYGGVLLSPSAAPYAASELLEAFARAAAAPRVSAARVVDFAGRLAGDSTGFESRRNEAQILELGREFDELWNGFKPSVRNKVRKASNAGVTVRLAVSLEDFLTYHGMLEECSTRWGVGNVFTRDFFAALFESGSERVQVLLAVHDDLVIAGDLNFLWKDTVFNWGNVSRNSARSLGANSLLHAHAIELAVEGERRTYNLGSSAGIEGVESFKSAFGTRKVSYRTYFVEKRWYRALKSVVARRA